MRAVSIILLSILIATGMVSVSAAAGDATAPSHPPFVVFDGLLYVGKPNLRPLGMVPIRGINPPVGIRSADTVDDAKVRATLEVLKGYSGAVYLDYEIWPTFHAPADEVSGNIEKLKRVVRIAHAQVPNGRIGFYDVIPCWDYWGLVKSDQTKIGAWKDCNIRIRDLAKEVDIVMPSLYTFYNDPQGWDIFAEAMLQAARQYGKPVYAFLWPEFHVSNRLLKGHNIPANFWRHELEFCRARADGIVIWGGYQEPWDNQAAWWLETTAFLAGLNPR